jgi:hypothetical protein
MINQGQVRSERRFGVTAQLSPLAVRNLYVLRTSETWPDLLDILEQCCIELETVLINTDPAEESAVLANHMMSKAAWMVFTHMQEKVLQATAVYLSGIAPQPEGPELTAEEKERENILNPLNYPPDIDDLGIPQE